MWHDMQSTVHVTAPTLCTTSQTLIFRSLFLLLLSQTPCGFHSFFFFFFLRGHERTPSVTLWSLFLLCFLCALSPSLAAVPKWAGRQRRHGPEPPLKPQPQPLLKNRGCWWATALSSALLSLAKERDVEIHCCRISNACHGLILCRWILAWPVLKQNPSTPGISWLF